MNYRKVSIILLLFCTLTVKSYSDDHNILLVHSYHGGYLWTDSITKGIERALEERPEISLHFEYLDSKKQYDESYKELIYNLIEYKFNKHHYDLIITSDNNAFELIYSFKESLFPTTPILFCGLNSIDPQIDTYTNLTGVYELADIPANIELIYRLQPKLKKIVVIADDTVTGRAIQEQIKEIQQVKPEWKLELVNNLSMEELLKTLQSIDRDTAVLLTVFFRDNNGVFYEYDRGTELITSNISSPVYALWDFNLNHGVVGGLVVDGKKHGEIVAGQALRIIDGTDINSIPIEYNTPTSLIFDYAVSSHFKLDTRGVDGITYINRPPNIWNQYRDQIILLLIIILLLSLAVYGLTHSLIISRRSKREYLSLVNNIPGVTYRSLFDHCYSMMIIGEGISVITEYKSIDFLNSSICLSHLIVEDYRESSRDVIKEALKNREPFTLEYRLRDRSGNLHWIQDRGRGIFNERGKLLYIDGLLLDITHQKNLEDDLKHYRQHLEELVEERTRHLNNAQEHIIESAKMTSLALIISGVAHEINTPAGICLTSLSYLKDEVKSLLTTFSESSSEDRAIVDDLKRYLKTIELGLSSISKINSLINNFKQMSVDQNDESPRLLNISQYFKKIFSELYSGERFDDLTIEFIVEDELIIKTHPGVLTQIFTYLIQNSLDHGFNNSRDKDKKITITIEKLEEHIQVSYRDSGSGISEESREKIFEPFYTTSRHEGHHGLGLSIVYNLVLRKLNGSIKYNTEKASFDILFKPEVS